MQKSRAFSLPQIGTDPLISPCLCAVANGIALNRDAVALKESMRRVINPSGQRGSFAVQFPKYVIDNFLFFHCNIAKRKRRAIV